MKYKYLQKYFLGGMYQNMKKKIEHNMFLTW